jgi:hypothetical protein
VASSYIYDPLDDTSAAVSRPMLMPAVDPTGRYVVYWSGTVRFDSTTGLWQPGLGDLYFDSWARVLAERPVAAPSPTEEPSPIATAVESTALDASASDPLEAETSIEPTSEPSSEPTPEATPSFEPSSEPTPEASPSSEPTAPASATPAPTATPTDSILLPQRLDLSSSPGRVASWVVRWDATGRYLAVWLATGPGDSGRVTLLNVLPGLDLVNLGNPLLSTPSRSSVSFDGAQFAYSSPAEGGDGKTYLFALPATPPGASATPTVTPAANGTPIQAATPGPTESYAPIFGS